MNEIIAWIATNNTLLIRIGFTAIVVLMGVYIFRLLFVPKTSPAATESVTPEAAAAKVVAAPVEPKVAEPPKAAEPAAPTKQQLEEIERLKSEVQRLTSQLAESEIQMQSLLSNQAAEKAENSESSESTGAATATGETAIENRTATSGNADAIAVASVEGDELRKKIEHLEARLAEYEIIADDISEIGQLREENSRLKNQLGDAAPVEAVAAVESAGDLTHDLVDDSAVFETNTAEEAPTESIEDITEEVLAEAVAESASETSEAGVVAASSDLKLQNEKEVTQTEKELIAQFEVDSERKGS